MKNDDHNSQRNGVEKKQNTKTSHKNDLIVNDDRKYTEEEVEEKVTEAVNEALNSEFMTMLKNDHGFKDKLLKDALLAVTSFKGLGFLKGILFSIFVYSGLLAIYTLVMEYPSFKPEGSILIFGLILAIIDKTVRPIILMIERNLHFKTSGFLFTLTCSTVVYYVSILLDKEFNIVISFTSYYELFFMITILLLILSMIDYFVGQYVSRHTIQNILGSDEKHE